MGHTRNAAVALLACLLGLLAACDAHELAPTPGDHAPESSLARATVLETFARDGEHLVSPVLEAPLGATRVALMLDTLPSAAAAVSFEARGVRGDGSAGEWLPLEVRWEEHPAYVLRVDLGEAFTAAELRLAAGDIDDVEWLLWSAFVPSPEADAALEGGELPEGVELPEIGLHDPGLAAQPLLGGVQPRSAWNARAPVCSSTDNSKHRISVHHTVTPRTTNGSYAQRIRAIQSFHIDGRGWCDIGYHVMVTADGGLWQARPENRLGTHVGNQNTGNLGVSLVGCFNSTGCANMGGTTAPAAMINSTSQIIATAAQAFNISISASTVMGHRDNPGQSTSCPGSNVHGQLGAIRTAAINGGAQPTTGRLVGTVWDLSVTTDVSQSLALNARLPGATVTTQGGQQVTAPSGEAIWQMNVEPGTYTVTAAKAGYESASSTVTVTAGADTWASIGLSPTATTGRAVGTVWDLSITADPSQSAALQARLPGAKVRSSSGAEATVPDGDAIWELHLPPGTHTLTASLEGFEDATREVTITAGANSWSSMGLQPVASTADVTVVVFDADGGPSAVLEDASVTFSGAGQESTDADGRATKTVAAGDITVRVEAEGYEPVERNLTVVAGQPLLEEIGLTASSDDDDDEDPEPADAFVTFIVFDLESGDPVADAKIGVDGLAPALTDEEGRATLTLTPGTVTAQVTRDGYVSTEVSLSLEAGAVVFEEVGLALEASHDSDVNLDDDADVGRVAVPQADGDEVALGSCAQASGSAPPLVALLLCVAFVRRRRHA